MPNEGFVPAQGTAELGESRLTLPDAVAQSVGFMGPVLSGALLLPLVVGAGAAGQGAGVAAPLAIALAAAGVACIGYLVSLYARHISSAGALYDYVRHGFGERIGFLAGWLYFAGVAVFTTEAMLLIGGLTSSFLASAFGIEAPYWALTILFSVAGFCVLSIGVRVSTRAQLLLVGVSLGAFVVFCFSVILQGGASGNSLRAFSPSETSFSGMFYGVLYAIVLFTGFEAAASLGEEAAEPRRSIPRAVLMSIAVATAFYLLAGYAQAAGFGFQAETWAADPAPLLTLAGSGEFGGQLLGRVFEGMIILDLLAVALGIGVTASRGLFAMSRDGCLPRVLSRTHARRGTPVAAIGFLMALAVAVALWVRLDHGVLAVPDGVPEYYPMFVFLVSLGAFGLVVVYAAVSLGAIRGLWSVEHKGRLLLAGTVGFLISLGGLFGAWYKVEGPPGAIAYVTAGWIAVGVVVHWAITRRGPLPSGALRDLDASESPLPGADPL